MYGIYLKVLLLVTVACLSYQQKPKVVKMIKVYRFAPCNTTSSIIQFNTSNLTVIGGINELNIVGFVNITRDIPSPITMWLTSQKCDLQGFNCEDYLSFGYPDCCHFLHIPFFSFLKGFEPEIKSCPIKKTILKALDSWYDMTPWMQVAMHNKYLVKYDFFDEAKNTIICFEIDWAILQKRVFRKSKNDGKKNN